jgi:muramoyltetrapeptide carboxypeptidase
MRLIPELNKLAKPKKQKIFLGFSDITSLHIFFTQKWNWTTYHGPNFSSMFKKDPLAQDMKEVMHLLHGEKYNPIFEGLIPLNKAAKKKSVITSKVTGGNLRMVQSGIKTLHEMKTKNKILFFEDVGERGYSIDRMFEQMIQCGSFKDVKAVIFGDFSEGLEKDGSDKKMDALKSFAEKVNFPVLAGLPSGHEKLNRVLPFNQKCQLMTGTQPKLVF